MSEIQRYETIQYPSGANPAFMPSRTGRYCLYTDLVFYRRMYGMAATMLVIVCIVFAAFLVTGKHAPQPVRTAAVQTSQAGKSIDDQIEKALAPYRQALANYESQWKDQEKRNRDWSKLVANLEAQVKAQNALLNAAQQTDVLKMAAKPIHDGELFKIAKGFGFTKVRMNNE